MKRILVLTALLSFLMNTSMTVTIQNLHASRLTPATQHELKNIFMDSFREVYIKEWDTVAVEQEEIFERYFADYRTKSNMVLFTAYKDGQLAGWALYKKLDDKNAILEILCISPTFWRQGIGSQPVFSICKEYPSINHISLVTRDINSISPQFYEAQGFKKTSFRLPEYNHLENLLGFEWQKE